MAEIKLTKNELRAQQESLGQLQRYLPTLQLKKALLQDEVQQIKQRYADLLAKEKSKRCEVLNSLILLKDAPFLDIQNLLGRKKVIFHKENVAGVEIPVFEQVEFFSSQDDLVFSPIWLESLKVQIKEYITHLEEKKIVLESQRLLEKELREVLIRVNLFEKILIPRALANIKKIKIFLADQQLTAVSQAKMAKKKILFRKQQTRASSCV